tara:strand:+ start:350 stop:589 length:240 start_codon:yes stop_codon:yes gene_type:complete
MMTKTATIKMGLRQALAKRPTPATITRPDPASAAVAVGDWTLTITFSPHNEAGDLATEAEHTAIFDALSGIVAEHNAGL